MQDLLYYTQQVDIVWVKRPPRQLPFPMGIVCRRRLMWSTHQSRIGLCATHLLLRALVRPATLTSLKRHGKHFLKNSTIGALQTGLYAAVRNSFVAARHSVHEVAFVILGV
jgi:hypothetical protein